MSLIGGVLIAVGFSLIGPIPIFPFKKSIGLIIGSLVLHGEKLNCFIKWDRGTT